MIGRTVRQHRRVRAAMRQLAREIIVDGIKEDRPCPISGIYRRSDGRGDSITVLQGERMPEAARRVRWVMLDVLPE